MDDGKKSAPLETNSNGAKKLLLKREKLEKKLFIIPYIYNY